MSNALIFHLTEEDIADAKRYGVESALLYLLCNRTGTLWSLTGAGAAIEIMEPYRGARFFVQKDEAWQTYQARKGDPMPSCIRVDVAPLDACPQREMFGLALTEVDSFQDSIAAMAYRFFEARTAQSKISTAIQDEG